MSTAPDDDAPDDDLLGSDDEDGEDYDPWARFIPLSVQLGDEDEMLERAHRRIDEVDPGSVVVLPEYLAWTRQATVRAYLELASVARAHNVNIITTLSMPPDITEDLPERDRGPLYNAVIVFTRHGDVHVPQAKVLPQPYETSTALDSAGIGVTPYHRLNKVQLDTGDELIEALFVVSSDLWLLTRYSPADIRCDLLIVPGHLPSGAEAAASRVLARVRESGAARATLLVNAHQDPPDHGAPFSIGAEELRDDGAAAPAARFPAELHDEFVLLPDDTAPSFAALARSPARKDRIPVPRSRTDIEVPLARYAITIAL